MFCKYCGNAVEDAAAFCVHCGRALKQTPPAGVVRQDPAFAPQPAPVYSGAESTSVPKPPKSPLGLRITAIVLAVVLVLGAAVVALFSIGPGEPSSSFSASSGEGAEGEAQGEGDNLGGGNGQGTSVSEDGLESAGDGSVNKTVMIYMVASDLESKYGSGTQDIQEMIDSTVDTSRHNVLIYTGGTRRWKNDLIPSDKNCIWRLTEDDIELVDQTGLKNMASPDTLRYFLNFGVTHYPQSQYSVILWNHGCGPMGGYGADENYSMDMMSITEVSSALSSAGFGVNNKLEFLGYDACLMGTAEVAWTVRDQAEFFIASQELEPGFGWNYRFLNALDEYDSGAAIGRVIVDEYFAFAEENGMSALLGEMTLSCLNLDYMPVLNSDMNQLFSQVGKRIESGYFAKASRIRNSVKAFGRTDGQELDLIDLFHLNTLLSTDYADDAGALSDTLSRLIVYSKSGMSNASGLSIYHPYYNEQYRKTWLASFRSLGFASDYGAYMERFCTLKDNANSAESYRDFSGAQVQVQQAQSSSGLSVQLTEEQALNYAGSTYYVLKKIGDNYLFVFFGSDAKLSEDGVLFAEYDNKAIYAVNDKTGAAGGPIPMYQEAGSEDVFVASALFYKVDPSDFEVLPVLWRLKAQENGSVLPQGAYEITSEQSGFASKNILNYKDFDVVEFSFTTRVPTRDQNGNLLPYFEWTSNDSQAYGHDYAVEDGFHFAQLGMEDKTDFYVMFEVRDVQGNAYTTELVQMN